MTEDQVLELLTRIEDHYDLPSFSDQQRVDRWVKVMHDVDAVRINRAFDEWMQSDHGYKPPAPNDLKRLVPAIAESSGSKAEGVMGMRSGIGRDEHGDLFGVLQESPGVWRLIPRSQLRNQHLDLIEAAMRKEGSIPAGHQLGVSEPRPP